VRGDRAWLAGVESSKRREVGAVPVGHSDHGGIPDFHGSCGHGDEDHLSSQSSVALLLDQCGDDKGLVRPNKRRCRETTQILPLLCPGMVRYSSSIPSHAGGSLNRDHHQARFSHG